MTPLVIVRPEPGAALTASRARLLGLEPSVCPLFEAKALPWAKPDPDQFDALVLTSANTVRLGGAGLWLYHQKPVFAVGERTASAARDAGFGHVTAGSSDGHALIASAVARGCRGFLHLAGADSLPLTHPGATIAVVPVYEATALDPLPDLLTVLEQAAVVMIHSPRAGRAIAALCKKRDHLQIVAISHGAAIAVGTGWQDVRYPQYPRDEAMLELASQMCNCEG